MTESLNVDEAADRTTAALADLLVATVRAGGRGRFAQVQRLACIGQQLEQALGASVADFPEAGRAMGALNVPHAHVALNPAQQGDDDDHAGLVRQLLLLVGPYLQNLTEEQRSRMRTDEAQELVAVNEALQKASALVESDLKVGRSDVLATWNRREYETLVKARESIITKMEARAKLAQETDNADEDDPADSDVVPADLPRRHPALGEGGGADGGAGVRSDARGGAGDGGTPEEGPQAGLAAGAVG